MKIYDEGIFFSHLEMEIAKSERFGYPFALLAIRALNSRTHTIALLTSILEANYRTTDLVAKRNDGTYFILLNGTTEEQAQNYMVRLIQKAVSENEIPVIAAVTSYKKNDVYTDMIVRLVKKLK